MSILENFHYFATLFSWVILSTEKEFLHWIWILAFSRLPQIQLGNHNFLDVYVVLQNLLNIFRLNSFSIKLPRRVQCAGKVLWFMIYMLICFDRMDKYVNLNLHSNASNLIILLMSNTACMCVCVAYAQKLFSLYSHEMTR